jgi:hypothetical protein
MLGLLVASCSAIEEQNTVDVCPVEGRESRQHSCVAIKAEASKFPFLSAWANPNNFWPKSEDGTVKLAVAFLGGDKTQRQQAFKRFSQIDELADGLQVRLVGPGEKSDIRCAFECSGHWSYLGRTARTISREKATMNIELDAFSPSKEWDRVALHEFCHALGLEHEHQHPDASIPWDVPVVIEDYRRTQGWSESQTRYQVLDRQKVPNAWKTAFDKKSLMLYPIPGRHTKNRLEVGWNTQLSALDIEMIRRIFPAP